MPNSMSSQVLTLVMVAATGGLVAVGLLSQRVGKRSRSLKDLFRGSKKKTPKSNATNDQKKTATVRAFLQAAKDQANQAESACSRASSGPKNSRLAAAEQAYYHARAANEAASKATNAAEGGPLEAADTAAQARNVAAQAQSACDRAKYNASKN